jgi:MoaA/NifB/PqqE/SkfB family radical SAM enzyme
LSQREAFDRYLAVKERLGKLNVAGIAGPGDALANFEPVRETFTRIREADSEVTFCLSTNALLLPLYAAEIAELGVSHVTVTVNAVDPAIAKRIYRYVDYEGTRRIGVEAAEILIGNQLAGIAALRRLGIVCKVNIVMLRGLNDAHIPAVVERVKEAGADISNIMQLIPVKGSLFEHLPLVSNAEISQMRKDCEALLSQMYHCRQCRADAIGTLDYDLSLTLESKAPPCHDAEEGVDTTEALLFALASKDGMVVDQHFGQATIFYIYEYRNGQARFVERRPVDKYCYGPHACGDHESTMQAILRAIAGCSCVIAVRIGDAPRTMLAERGIKSCMTYNYAVDAVREAAALLG